MKRFFCLFLSVMLILGCTVPAMAADTDGGGVSAEWASGGIESTHQFLTNRLLAILANDKPNAAAILSPYSGILLAYSDWPDTFENDGGLYTSHFYNPYTGKTFLGSTTALNRFTTHANNAKKYYAKNRTLAMQELGKALHFLSDINEPHHAALLIAGLTNHSTYEAWVDANLSSFAVGT